MTSGPARQPAEDVWHDVVGRLRAAGCVFAEEEADLLLEAVGGPAAAEHARLDALVARRVAGEPLEHLLGWAEFAGWRWSVGPGVFVPRRRTELMVRTALDALRVRSSGSVVVDLCCGCGAVGGAVLREADDVVLHASDVEPAATAHARHNLEALGATVTTGDLFDPLTRDLQGHIDVLLCNAPYVPTGAIRTMPPEARDHEPRTALDGGDDGLEVVRRVLEDAPSWLSVSAGRHPGGILLFEVGTAQIDVAADAVESVGMTATIVHDEDAGGTIVVAGR